MKRRSFLRLSAAIVPMAAVPFVAQATPKVGEHPGKWFRVGKGESHGKSLSLFEGDTFDCKISGKDTGGAMYAFESTRIKKGGPSYHLHYDQDEWFYILEGEFLFKVGGETFTAKAGDCVFGARKIPHAFSKISEGEARMMIVFQPAGKMEEFFTAASKGVLAKMTEAEQDKYRIEHGFERVGPALSHLKI